MPKDNPKFQACVSEKIEGGMNQGTAEAMCKRELVESGEYYEEEGEGAEQAAEAPQGNPRANTASMAKEARYS